MTNEEAIKNLESEEVPKISRDGFPNDNLIEAHIMAISALEKQMDSGWVKCSERLPEYTDNYNVTVGIGSMLGYFEEVRTYRYEIFNGKNPYRKWIIPNNANEIVNVIAWQNLPTKYSESEDK